MSPQWLLAISPLEHWIAVSDNTLLVENLAIVHSNIAPSEFSSSDLEKCSLASLSQQWMLCSEWVPSEWESKQLILWCFYQTLILTAPIHCRVQTADIVRFLSAVWTQILTAPIHCRVKTADIVMFLSAVWTQILTAPIHCRVQTADIVMFLSAAWTLILTAPIHCRVQTADIAMFLSFV